MKNSLIKNCTISSKELAAKILVLLSLFVSLSCQKSAPALDYSDIVSGSYRITQIRSGDNVANLPSNGVSGTIRVNRVAASSVSIEFNFIGLDSDIPTAIYDVRGGDNADELDFFGNGANVATHYIADEEIIYSINTTNGLVSITAKK
jgi:hypothetical protein